MASANLDDTYREHELFGNQGQRQREIAGAGRAFAEVLKRNAPPSRELSLAFTDVQRAVQMGRDAIAINEKPLFHPDITDQVDERMLPLTKAQYDQAVTAASTRAVQTVNSKPAEAQTLVAILDNPAEDVIAPAPTQESN